MRSKFTEKEVYLRMRNEIRLRRSKYNKLIRDTMPISECLRRRRIGRRQTTATYYRLFLKRVDPDNGLRYIIEINRQLKPRSSYDST